MALVIPIHDDRFVRPSENSTRFLRDAWPVTRTTDPRPLRLPGGTPFPVRPRTMDRHGKPARSVMGTHRMVATRPRFIAAGMTGVRRSPSPPLDPLSPAKTVTPHRVASRIRRPIARDQPDPARSSIVRLLFLVLMMQREVQSYPNTSALWPARPKAELFAIGPSALRVRDSSARTAHPEIIMHTLSLAGYVACTLRGDGQGVAELTLLSANTLTKIGVDFLIRPDNSIHQALPYVERRSPLVAHRRSRRRARR
jgi:hypothetical protein